MTTLLGGDGLATFVEAGTCDSPKQFFDRHIRHSSSFSPDVKIKLVSLSISYIFGQIFITLFVTSLPIPHHNRSTLHTKNSFNCNQNTDNISAAIGFSGPNMAAILLSCLGLTTSKLRAKQRAKKEREQEYEENFDILKEQNANRVRQLSNQGSYQGSTDGRTLYGDGVTDHAPEMQQHHSRNCSTAQPTAAAPAPPKYDDIVEETASRHSG